MFAFGLISQYRNDMKELFDNRPSENAVTLRKVWKLVKDTESQKNPQKKNTGNHLFYNASIFFLNFTIFISMNASHLWHMSKTEILRSIISA